MDLDFDPVGVVLTAQAGGGASPPKAWVSEKKTTPPCRGGSLDNDCGMGISRERPLQGRGVVGLCTQAFGGEAPPPAWAVRTVPTGRKKGRSNCCDLSRVGKGCHYFLMLLRDEPMRLLQLVTRHSPLVTLFLPSFAFGYPAPREKPPVPEYEHWAAWYAEDMALDPDEYDTPERTPSYQRYAAQRSEEEGLWFPCDGGFAHCQRAVWVWAQSGQPDVQPTEDQVRWYAVRHRNRTPRQLWQTLPPGAAPEE